MNGDTEDTVCLCHSAMAGEVAALLRGLAHEQRLMIVALLLEWGEMNIATLVENLGTDRAALTRHLNTLHTLGVITTRRHHNRIYYTLSHDKVRHIITTLGLSFSAQPKCVKS